MGEFSKAIVALIMAILIILEQIYGWEITGSGITEEWITNVLAILTPILVWLIPNRTRYR